MPRALLKNQLGAIIHFENNLEMLHTFAKHLKDVNSLIGEVLINISLKRFTLDAFVMERST